MQPMGKCDWKNAEYNYLEGLSRFAAEIEAAAFALTWGTILTSPWPFTTFMYPFGTSGEGARSFCLLLDVGCLEEDASE
jgi:hypothetical protein